MDDEAIDNYNLQHTQSRRLRDHDPQTNSDRQSAKKFGNKKTSMATEKLKDANGKTLRIPRMFNRTVCLNNTHIQN